MTAKQCQKYHLSSQDGSIGIILQLLFCTKIYSDLGYKIKGKIMTFIERRTETKNDFFVFVNPLMVSLKEKVTWEATIRNPQYVQTKFL